MSKFSIDKFLTLGPNLGLHCLNMHGLPFTHLWLLLSQRDKKFSVGRGLFFKQGGGA